MNFPKTLKYTKTHEWAKKEQNRVSMGISDYAQKEISDVVFVELPQVGRVCEAGKSLAVVESVKAAFDIYAPVSGKVVRVNTELESNPAKVNEDCYGNGWLVELESTDEKGWNELLSASEYEAHTQKEHH